MPDIIFNPTKAELLIHPWSRKGAGWIWKHLTTNVTTLHYTDPERGQEVLAAMRQDGLKVVTDGEYARDR